MPDPQAAIRETDEATHSHALAGAITGIVAGLVIGAVIGAVIVGTGGLGAIALVAGGAALTTSTAMVGATLLGATLVGGSIGGMFGKMFGRHATYHKASVLTGSPNVFIGTDRKRAARAEADVAHCEEHADSQTAHDQPGVLGNRIVQGSGTVLINGFPAARQGDRGKCDFVLGKGWDTVFVGGPTVTMENIDGEVPPIVDHIIAGMGIVGTGLLMLPGAVAMFSAGTAAGLTGGVLRVGANLLQVGLRLGAQYEVGKKLSEWGGEIGHGTAQYFGAKDNSLASDTATLVGQTAAPFAGAEVYKGIADAPLPNMRAAPTAGGGVTPGGDSVTTGEPQPTAANDNAPAAANDNAPAAANDNAPSGTTQQLGKNSGGTPVDAPSDQPGGTEEQTRPANDNTPTAANDNTPGGTGDGETSSGETTEQPGTSKGGKAGEAPPEQAEDGAGQAEEGAATEAGNKDAAAGESDPTVQAGDVPGGEGEENTAEEEPEDALEPPSRETGLSDRATGAIEKLENVKADPVGDVNSEANHNHYAAARREASGEVVARKTDGTPFDHIGDLQRASSALNNVRQALEAEMRNPPEGLTERGLDVLQRRYSEVQSLQSRLKGFLGKIGQGQFPPYHTWPPGS